VGIWHVTEIYDWGKGFGGTWIGLNVPWGVYGIHGTKEPWLVGKKNVSHGCIRMKDEDAIEVKNLVTIGSSVQIKQDSLPFRNMGKSMTGSDVYNTQIMLKNLGFYTGTIDGIFGEGMERAVKSFQRTYYLEDDGIIGKTTYEKIIEQNRIKTG
ncbi:MAG TPA: peptidoglycan-binding protein, partial [Clostridiales bacterium]|nr:peptidoglycan-binding protein [Clostridiales bacterium]